jgi:hypothetical protein
VVIALIFFGIIGLASELINLPFGWYDTFVIEKKYGFNTMTTRIFITDQLKSWFIALLVGIPVLGLITWIYYKTGTGFWLYAWGLITVFSVFINFFYSEWIVPLFNRQTPLIDSPLRTKIEEFTEKAGFRILRGEGVTIDGIINVAGVDDIVAGRYGNNIYTQEKTALSGMPPQLFTVLLKHRPVVDVASAKIFDLQLSGHTHNGQLFPFTYLTRIAFPMYAGLHRLEGNSILYVSPGTGTWGPPIRFLSPPEVTVIEVVRKGSL